MNNQSSTTDKTNAEVLHHYLQSNPEIFVNLPLKSGHTITVSFTFQSKQWVENILNDFRESRAEGFDYFMQLVKSGAVDTSSAEELLNNLRDTEIKLLQVAQQVLQHDNVIVMNTAHQDQPIADDPYAELFNLKDKDIYHCYDAICALQRGEMFFLKFPIIFLEMITPDKPLSAEALQEIDTLNSLSEEERNTKFLEMANCFICLARQRVRATRDEILTDVDTSTLDLYKPSVLEKIEQTKIFVSNK